MENYETIHCIAANVQRKYMYKSVLNTKCHLRDAMNVQDYTAYDVEKCATLAFLFNLTSFIRLSTNS